MPRGAHAKRSACARSSQGYATCNVCRPDATEQSGAIGHDFRQGGEREETRDSLGFGLDFGHKVLDGTDGG